MSSNHKVDYSPFNIYSVMKTSLIAENQIDSDYTWDVKRRLTIFLTISLMIGNSAFASMAPKAGALCSKKGQVKVHVHTRFTCTKSGNRLIWSKGIPTKSSTTKVQPTPSPSSPVQVPVTPPNAFPTMSPSPIPTASPSVTATPSSSPISTSPALGPNGNYVYRYVQGIQERKNIDGIWLQSDPRTVNDFDPIRVAAYKSITSLQVDQNHSNIRIEYNIRPNFPSEIAEILKLQIISAARVFSPLLDTRATIKIVGLTEKDQSFADQDLPNIIPRNSYGNSLDILKDYGTLERFYSRGGTGGGSAGYLDQLGYGFYLAHTSSLATLDTYWPEVPPHEMAHFLQGFLARGAVNNYGEGHPESKWHGHLIEGSANTLGMAMGFSHLGWYSDEMDKLLKRNISYFSKQITINSEQDAINLINEIERRNNEMRNELSYAAGQVIWEYFIGNYGIEKFIELLRNLPKTANFNDNLRVTIGRDKTTFYKEAGGYLFTQWLRLSK